MKQPKLVTANLVVMDTDDPLVIIAVDATIDRIHHTAAAILRRNQAWWDLRHVRGWKLQRIANSQRDALLARGYTDEQIKGSGVGFENIRKIVGGERPEE